MASVFLIAGGDFRRGAAIGSSSAGNGTKGFFTGVEATGCRCTGAGAADCPNRSSRFLRISSASSICVWSKAKIDKPKYRCFLSNEVNLLFFRNLFDFKRCAVRIQTRLVNLGLLAQLLRRMVDLLFLILVNSLALQLRSELPQSLFLC